LINRKTGKVLGQEEEAAPTTGSSDGSGDGGVPITPEPLAEGKALKLQTGIDSKIPV
jgi:hypothetical protein